MHREELGNYVAKIETSYAARPVALRVRAAAIIAIGYLGFLLWFALLLVAGVLLFLGSLNLDSVGGFLLLALGAVLLACATVQGFQLLWVSVPQRNCRRLLKREAPRLFQLMTQLRTTSRSARVHEVFLTPDFNASVRHAPRLGVFGWSRNQLYLGLPLMEVLQPDEFEAVLAHEMAHLSKRHGRFTTWVYRLHSTWEQLFDSLHEAQAWAAIRWLHTGLVKFIDWYWPRFHAYSFVLSRANEYVADQFAADTVGKETAASALWRIECLFLHLHEKLLPDLWQLANDMEEPPPDPVGQLTAGLRRAPSAADAERWMARARSAITDHLNTHPSLADRLQAIEVDVGELGRRRVPARCRSVRGGEVPARFSARVPEGRRRTLAL